MTEWLYGFNYSDSFERNECFMQTNFVQIDHIQVYNALN